MNLEIINQLAHIMRRQNPQDPKDPGAAAQAAAANPEAAPAPEAVKEPEPATSQNEDSLSFSAEAERFRRRESEESLDAFDRDRRLQLERLKSLVKDHRYAMDETMVDEIATKIAKMFAGMP